MFVSVVGGQHEGAFDGCGGGGVDEEFEHVQVAPRGRVLHRRESVDVWGQGATAATLQQHLTHVPVASDARTRQRRSAQSAICPKHTYLLLNIFFMQFFEHILGLNLKKKQSRHLPYIPHIFWQNFFQFSDLFCKIRRRILQEMSEPARVLREMFDLTETEMFV